MTQTEINIAIAEACNHRDINGRTHDIVNGEVVLFTHYTADLDAMHEVEKYFDDKPVDLQSLYYDHLGHGNHYAPQRASARRRSLKQSASGNPNESKVL